MNSAETEMLYRYLDRATHYFEFGSGGSTYQAALRPNIKTITSVESDAQWVEKIRTALTELPSRDPAPQLRFLTTQFATTDHGNPVPGSSEEHRLAYAKFIEGYSPDLVFVDGRFRVSCCLQAWDRLLADGVLLIHDYDRKGYHVIEEFYDQIERVDTLVAFRKKETIDRDRRQVVLEHHLLRQV